MRDKNTPIRDKANSDMLENTPFQAEENMAVQVKMPVRDEENTSMRQESIPYKPAAPRGCGSRSKS